MQKVVYIRIDLRGKYDKYRVDKEQLGTCTSFRHAYLSVDVNKFLNLMQQTLKEMFNLWNHQPCKQNVEYHCIGPSGSNPSYILASKSFYLGFPS